MIKSASIEFEDRDSDIREPVTKSGGQPFWLEAPQWPISKELNEPMRFI